MASHSTAASPAGLPPTAPFSVRTALLPPNVRSDGRLPRAGAVDSTVALLREGYVFGLRRFRRYDTDLFRTRLMGVNAVVAYGQEAAAEFYRPDRMTRRWALPMTALTLLLDRGSVAMLDGRHHRWRKGMFLSFMTRESIGDLREIFAHELRTRAQGWRGGEVVLLDELHHVLCAAVCRWSGIPLASDDVGRRTRELTAMIEGAGAVGPRNLRGQVLRRRTERWARELIAQIREGRLVVDGASPVAVIAAHREPDGGLLPLDVAAVELINVLRPTVAVARFMTFAALALHHHPELRGRVAADDDERRWFVQEVRRTTPFFPMVGGRALEEFRWRDHHVPAGTWLLLDLYATNHDSRVWADPFVFRPERFRDRPPGPMTLVPQGGGDLEAGHRCAGEWLSIGLIEEAVRVLTGELDYEVPAQDLGVDLSRLPARPASGFRISRVSGRR